MGRDLAAILQLENLTGAASEHRLGLLPLGRRAVASFRASQHTPGLWAIFISRFVKQTREKILLEFKKAYTVDKNMNMTDASGTVHTPPEHHAQLRGPTGIQSGNLWLAEKMPVFLCPTPDDFNTGELGHDHLDSQSHELHNYHIPEMMDVKDLVSAGHVDGMGNLRITEEGLKLEGVSEFLQPLYAKEIQSRPGNALYFKSARNVTVNILNDQTKVLTQLITGPKAIEAYGKKFEVKTVSGKLLFSADNNEVVVGAERLRVLGAEGTVFPKSIETPNVRADPFKELRLESPTRSLVMEAPKGVEINAEAGNMEATCRTELRLESKDGEIKLDAAKIKLPRLPHGSYTPTGTRQKVFEICVCANGRLFLSQAGTGSTCQINTSVCL
uniref:Sarcoglycan delta n=1 Tax=Equus caballus TaxID=9796 RepID=A0A9L0R0W5_HORSE